MSFAVSLYDGLVFVIPAIITKPPPVARGGLLISILRYILAFVIPTDVESADVDSGDRVEYPVFICQPAEELADT